MQLYYRASLKFAFWGILAISYPLIGSLRSKKDIDLTTAPEWYIKSTARQNDNYQQKLQALHILEQREIETKKKLTALYLFNQREGIPSSVTSSSDSESLSKQSGSSPSSLVSSSESFLSKLH